MKILVLKLSFLTQYIWLKMIQLLEASRTKNYKRVEQLITNGEEVDQFDINGKTAMLFAVLNDDSQMITLLARLGADVNWPNLNGDSFLIIASRYNKYNAAHALLDLGCDVNYHGHDYSTPIFLTSCPKLVKLLIDAGGDVNTINFWFETPLLQAVSVKNIEIVKVLIDAGADLEYTNQFGMSVLNNSQGNVRKLVINRLTLKKIRRQRYLQFKVVKMWSSFESLYSPTSNQMFYNMGSVLPAYTFEQLKAQIPSVTIQNYKFYQKGVDSF